jgi:hypothetical protein
MAVGTARDLVEEAFGTEREGARLAKVVVALAVGGAGGEWRLRRTAERAGRILELEML